MNKRAEQSGGYAAIPSAGVERETARFAYDAETGSSLRIGWAEADITPSEPVLLAGQFHARLSEGVADPLQATAWAIDSGADHAVFVACDTISVSAELRDAVRDRLRGQAAGLDPLRVILHATHSHTAPEIRLLFKM
ncbi:MAG: hypothetical protein K0Q94_5641 [Paenibacillus sp.]|nr:hypothetical protein [Paenibacillus sp.]